MLSQSSLHVEVHARTVVVARLTHRPHKLEAAGVEQGADHEHADVGLLHFVYNFMTNQPFEFLKAFKMSISNRSYYNPQPIIDQSMKSWSITLKELLGKFEGNVANKC